MADTLILAPDWPTGATLYLRLGSGTSILDAVAAPKAFVPLVVANWARYAIAVPESPAGSRRYYLDFLAFALANPAIVAGDYSWLVFLQAGGSPASSDVVIGSGGDHWTGTSFGPATGAVTLPSIPPQGYGNLSGAGTIIVTQDYGGTGALSAIDALGNGIGGATVTAFLTSDYTVNGRNATPKGQVHTTASGQWATGMALAAGAYTFLFSDRGYLANPATQVIS